MVEFEFRWTDPNDDVHIFITRSAERLKTEIKDKLNMLNNWMKDVGVDLNKETD